MQVYSGKLYQWQLDSIHKLGYDNRGLILTILAPRQIGKTHLIEMYSLHQLLNRKGYRVVVVNPTFANSVRTYNELVKYLGKLPPELVKSANGSTLLIQLANGSELQLKSIEQGNALRGDHCDLLILDEAAFLDTETAMSQLFPYVNATHGNILLISTPKFRDEANLFYKFYKLAQEGTHPEVLLHDWTKYDTSEVLSPERKAMLKQTMAWNIYANEIEGEFLTEESELWDFAPVLRNGVVATGDMFAGLDWGSTGTDETVLAIFNGQKQMYQLVRLNGNDLAATEQVKRLVGVLGDVGVRRCVYETNSIGAPMADFLKREAMAKGLKCQFIPFTTTNASKREAIERLQLEIQNQTITLLDDNALTLQFSQFQQKKTPSGVITYGNSSDSVHDDIVMATAFALSATKKGTYSLI